MSPLDLAVSLGELRREVSALTRRVEQLERATRNPDTKVQFIGVPA
jgi:hypothetical protein